MNTEMSANEAIERIQDHMRVHKLSEPRAHYINTAFEMAITALERRIALKIKIKHEQYYCPVCFAWFVEVTNGYVMDYNPHFQKWSKIIFPGLHGTTPYCGNCGQRLDWTNVGSEEM